MEMIERAHIEPEKAKSLRQMVCGCPELDRVVVHLRVVADLAQLDLSASDPAGVMVQAEKLLEAVGAESEFKLPAVNVAPAPAGGSTAAAETEWSGPWDPRDGSINIQHEIRKLLAEDPSLTLVTLHEPLRKRFPALNKTRTEVLAMNAPLPALKTGFHEQQKDGGYKLLVEPIGSTRA